MTFDKWWDETDGDPTTTEDYPNAVAAWNAAIIQALEEIRESEHLDEATKYINRLKVEE